MHYYDLAVEKMQQIEFEDYTYVKWKFGNMKRQRFQLYCDSKTYILAITKEVSMNRDLQDKYLFMRSVFFKTFLSTLLYPMICTYLKRIPRFIEDFHINIEEAHVKNFFELPFIDSESTSNY